MKILAVTLLIPLFALINVEAAGRRFDFISQIGVVEVRSQNELCLTISNGSVVGGSRLQIISPYRPQSVAVALVHEKLSSSCSRNPNTSPEDSFYSLRLVSGRVEPESVGIAVVGAGGGIRVARGVASADLNGDGSREYFRMCTSREGLHLTVWSGRAPRGVRRWHRYYYLGYDVEPNCTNKETR